MPVRVERLANDLPTLKAVLVEQLLQLLQCHLHPLMKLDGVPRGTESQSPLEVVNDWQQFNDERFLLRDQWPSICFNDTSEGTWSLVQDVMADHKLDSMIPDNRVHASVCSLLELSAGRSSLVVECLRSRIAMIELNPKYIFRLKSVRPEGKDRFVHCADFLSVTPVIGWNFLSDHVDGEIEKGF